MIAPPPKSKIVQLLSATTIVMLIRWSRNKTTTILVRKASSLTMTTSWTCSFRRWTHFQVTKRRNLRNSNNNKMKKMAMKRLRRNMMRRKKKSRRKMIKIIKNKKPSRASINRDQKGRRMMRKMKNSRLKAKRANRYLLRMQALKMICVQIHQKVLRNIAARKLIHIPMYQSLNSLIRLQEQLIKDS